MQPPCNFYLDVESVKINIVNWKKFACTWNEWKFHIFDCNKNGSYYWNKKLHMCRKISCIYYTKIQNYFKFGIKDIYIYI